ncbi:hypothetical protein ACJZRZ_003835 [Vibrio parahaemolyticus]
MTILYVYDDEGTLEQIKVRADENLNQVAIRLIDSVIEWTNHHGGAIYSVLDCHTHMTELSKLKTEIDAGIIDVSEPDWFESVLGFTFSVLPGCGKYPGEEVLPNEEGRCSLCDSQMNASGECLYVNPS